MQFVGPTVFFNFVFAVCNARHDVWGESFFER